MNSAIKSATVHPQNYLKAAFFHSTPVLERKRRTSWDSRPNSYEKRYRRVRGKKEMLRNINMYADYLLQSWQNDLDEDDPSSSGFTWFRNHYSKGSRRDRAGKPGAQHHGRRYYKFCIDDDDGDSVFENVFGFAFGGNRCNQEDPDPRWFRYSTYHGRSWNWESSTESDSSDSDIASDRLALGLSPSGPLKLEDIKNAYRSCALKWHPDRHVGSLKAVAEEKFKHCSAAYQSLCDKLAVD